MKAIWFRQLGLFYIPIHVYGYIITMLAIVFMVPVAIATLKSGQTVGDDLYQLFVYLTCTAFWWKWIADKTSEK